MENNPIPNVDFRPNCECGKCERKLVLIFEDWFSLKAHYRGKKIMAPDCDNYTYDNFYIVEEGKGYKVVGYG